MPSTRRTYLTAVAGTAVALSGCSGVFGNPDPDDVPTATPGEDIDPSDHIYGATGEWSSFGCNAANNRSVEDGQAPHDGVNERWRVSLAGQLSIREPLVADGTVFFGQGGRLTAYDADDGTEQWNVKTDTHPLVRDGVVYVPKSTTEEHLLAALDAETGETLWTKSFSETVGSPCTFEGRWLMFSVGERVVWLHRESRDIRHERQVFGEIRQPPTAGQTGTVTVTTQAGHVYILHEGRGIQQWRLPTTPKAPPVYDQDGLYVNGLDSQTYALGLESGRAGEVSWTVDTGWADFGVAVARSQLFTADRELTAVDAESGETAWTYPTGDWRLTAPVYARDTVFVGGDKLYALDPDPGGNLENGPAVRFERDLGGRVGPGPIIDDGRLYVVVGTDSDEGSTDLVAFDPA